MADALSRKSSGSLIALCQLEKTLQGDFCRSGIELITGRLSSMMLESVLLEKIKQGQKEDPELIGHKKNVESGKKSNFNIFADGVIRFQDRLCVPDDGNIKEEILTETHNTPYSVHLGTTQMYNDLKILY